MSSTPVSMSPSIPSRLCKRGGFVIENPGYNNLKSVLWKVEPGRVTLYPAFGRILVTLPILCALGPGLSWAWYFEWPPLAGLFDPLWARIAMSCLILVGWVGLLFAVFGRRRVVFDTAFESVFFYSRLPSLNYRLDLDRVVKYKLASRKRIYSDTSPGKIPYKTYEFKLSLKEANITLFETRAEERAIEFGELVSQMTGIPFDKTA